MATKQVFVEVRVDKDAPKIQRFHMVQDQFMSSSKIYPDVSRADSNNRYYEYSALLSDRRKCLIVIDLEPARGGVKRSEIYNLRKHGLASGSKWSDWHNPDSTVNPSHVLGASFQALNTHNPPDNIYQTPQDTNIRYRIEKWSRP